MVAPAKSNSTQRRDTTRHYVYAGVIIWAISIVLIGAIGSYVVIRSQQQAQALCRVSNDNRSILINVLTVSKNQMLETASDFFERNIIRQRYNELVAAIPPLDCSLKGGPKELEP